MRATPGTMAYAKGFIDRLDQVQVEGAPLGSHRVADRYDFTPFYRLWDLYRVQCATSPKEAGGAHAAHAHPASMAAILVLSALSFLYHTLLHPRILLYAIDKVSSIDRDHDARLEGVYRYLYKHRTPFVELMHTMPAESFWPNLMIRRRIPIYFEAADVLFSVARRVRRSVSPVVAEYDLSAFATGEQELARRLIAERMLARERSAFRIRTFTWVLRFLRPTACFMIDDAKYYGELLAACEEVGIPSYAFQHGHFTEYHVGFLAHPSLGTVPVPDIYFVWSAYWKEELEALHTYVPQDRIRVGGVVRPIPDAIAEPTVDRTLHILVPYETVAPKSEVREALNELLKDPSVHLYFKIRKDTSRSVQLEDYQLQPGPQVSVIDDIRLASRIDVVLGTYSTFLYDMVAQGLPIALLATSSDYGKGMLRTELATLVGEGGYVALAKELRARARLSTKERRKLRELLFGATPVLLSDTLEELGRNLKL